MSTLEGIRGAIDLGFGSSGLADVIETPYIGEAASMFHPPDSIGRCFALMRHPIERAISKFYYLRISTWEKDFSSKYKNITIEKYARDMGENNWMTRKIIQKMNGPLNLNDLNRAKSLLEKRCIIGLTDRYMESLNRFQIYFNWDNSKIDECQKKLMVNKKARNINDHPTFDNKTLVWNFFLKSNVYDVELYQWAVQLFGEQSNLFIQEKTSVVPSGREKKRKKR